jgi:MFS family permease
VPALVFLGMVVAVVSSLGAPLIPTVATDDHVSLSDAQWMLTIVYVVSAVATPTMGRLGDGPRRRVTILAGLAIVAVGSVLAALPLGFLALLIGRAGQGVGLGLTPLAITVARDTLPPERARPAVAMLSITTVAGVGLGYPVTAFIAELGGLHAAFWFGAIVAVAALAAAALVVPSSAHLPPSPLDIPGAAALGIGLGGLLLAISEGPIWGWGSPPLIAVGVVSLAVLAGWAVLELRASHPLVELRLLRRPVVLTADTSAVLAGVGMYLMLAVVTRLVQTPVSTGYGLGGSIAVAGLMMTPFSVASVAASSVTRRLLRRVRPARVLPLGAVVVLGASALFAFVHGNLAAIAVVMAVFGFGVGAIFAVMPGFIVGSVPVHETGSALSFNQVLRYIGYGIGSCLGGVVLQAATAPGHALPANSGYTVSGLIGCVVWAAAAGTALVLPRVLRRPPSAAGHEAAAGHEVTGGQETPAGTHLDADKEEAVAEMEPESAADALPYEEAGAEASPRVSRPGQCPGRSR